MLDNSRRPWTRVLAELLAGGPGEEQELDVGLVRKRLAQAASPLGVLVQDWMMGSIG
jgi:hypothetical protein